MERINLFNITNIIPNIVIALIVFDDSEKIDITINNPTCKKLQKTIK